VGASAGVVTATLVDSGEVLESVVFVDCRGLK
jgi:hypothetical protein